jgi:hypothetical protein
MGWPDRVLFFIVQYDVVDREIFLFIDRHVSSLSSPVLARLRAELIDLGGKNEVALG